MTYRNFRLLASGINILPLADQVHRHRHMFVDLAEQGKTHREAHLITVRYPDIPADANTNPEAFQRMSDDLFAKPHPGWHVFSQLKPLLYGLFELVEGTHIGGIGIIRLDPGKKIYPHYDTGLSTDFYSRYHIVIHGPPECWFVCGEGADEERVAMASGEIWSFDSKKLHSVVNESNEPRISVSVDLSSL